MTAVSDAGHLHAPMVSARGERTLTLLIMLFAAVVLALSATG
ncbi:MAG TPA: hypothetical protein VKA21_14300 [Candidatus Binatia bacterium]|nr:hypothetical protein [Candidatus Binatia bacterium]